VKDLNFRPTIIFAVLALAIGSVRPTLNASVTTAHLDASPTAINFGDVLVGRSQTQSEIVTNTSGVDVTIAQGSMNGSQFQVSGLTLPLTLPSGASITFNVTFVPTTNGGVTATLNLTALVSSSQDPNVDSASPLAIPLSGTGIAVPGVLQASSLALSFGSLQVGSSSTQSETLINSGDSTVIITEANLTGSAFSVSGLNLPLSLIPGQSFTMDVLFTPISAGSATGSISVISNASNSPLTISLSGTGGSPGQLSVTPTTLDFGSVVVGTSASLPVTLAATSSSVTVSSITTSSPEFTLSGSPLPITLAAGQSTSLIFTFAPQTSGIDAASIYFISTASNSPTLESLTGTGALSQSHKVDLSWNPSTSAVVGYNIYRSGNSGGPYSKINSALSATTTYTDDQVQSGVIYFYVTTAVDVNGTESTYSNQAQAVVPAP
jgi:Abnormal spindle-like microcephaly-assoc'd, ASPM-SPD-2-Hydin